MTVGGTQAHAKVDNHTFVSVHENVLQRQVAVTDSLCLQMMKAPQYLSKPVPSNRFRHAHLPTTLFRMLNDNSKKITVSTKGHNRVQKVSILQDFCTPQHVRMGGTQQLHGRHLLDRVFQ
jgi:hypothetical protein